MHKYFAMECPCGAVGAADWWETDGRPTEYSRSSEGYKISTNFKLVPGRPISPVTNSYLDGAPVCVKCDSDAECKEISFNDFCRIWRAVEDSIASYTITATRKVLEQATFEVQASSATVALTEANKRVEDDTTLQWHQAEIANYEIKVEKVGAP